LTGAVSAASPSPVSESIHDLRISDRSCISRFLGDRPIASRRGLS
jgi:hypothetical protein